LSPAAMARAIAAERPRDLAELNTFATVDGYLYMPFLSIYREVRSERPSDLHLHRNRRLQLKRPNLRFGALF
jgi:hypothetical protein